MIPRVTVLAKARVSLIRSVGRSVGGHEEYKFNSVRPAAAAADAAAAAGAAMIGRGSSHDDALTLSADVKRPLIIRATSVRHFWSTAAVELVSR